MIRMIRGGRGSLTGPHRSASSEQSAAHSSWRFSGDGVIAIRPGQRSTARKAEAGGKYGGKGGGDIWMASLGTPGCGCDV